MAFMAASIFRRMAARPDKVSAKGEVAVNPIKCVCCSNASSRAQNFCIVPQAATIASMQPPSRSDAPAQSLCACLSAPHACPYLAKQQARMLLVAPQETITTGIYAQLLEQGFRRSGGMVYRPRCPECDACLSLRVDVNRFTPNRSQRRAFKQHSTLHARMLPLAFDPEHYALYQAYQQARHAEGDMAHDDADGYRDFMLNSPIDSALVEFRDANNALKIVALIDLLPQALSAVYTFYADEPHTAYGTYAVLWQIAQAQRLQLPHVYLGYWIAHSHKMHYKARFRPCEIWKGGCWQPVINDR